LGKTVHELANSITLQEFVDWQRFALEHPLPADLIDTHCAMLVATLANVNRASNTPAFDPNDFRLMRPQPARPAAKAKPMLEADRMMLALAGSENA
jgi:hypothetical protein